MAEFNRNINRRDPRGNRRTFLRISMDQPVNYVGVSPREAELGQFLHPRRYQIGILLDISAGGMRFLGDTGIKEDSFIAVELVLPTFIHGPQVVFGRVIHKESHRIANQAAFRVRFEKLNDATQDRIIKFIFDRAAER